MKKVIDRYERFISSEDEMEVYNARDAFLYGQKLMLKREREEGRREEQIAIAKKFKNSGIDINIISENTGLSIEEINKL